MKKCTACKKIKEDYEFPKNKKGNRARCKECTNLDNQAYKRSKRGLIVGIYYHQKYLSKKRGHQPPTYTREELMDWLFSQKKFHILYDNWKRLDFQKDYVPSVDRKEDWIGYTMANIQLMTWKENREKGDADRKLGKNGKEHRPVIQMAKDGTFIREYFSIADAARSIGVDRSCISRCCTGDQKTAGGYKWKYKILE